MAGPLRYSRYTDNVAALASALTIDAGSADAAYPPANLVDLNPAKPAKLASTSGRFVWDFGAARRIDVMALIHHNLDAGLSVHVKGNATNAWGAPTLDAALTIPAYFPDGFCVNPWIDLTTIAGYSTAGFRFWALDILGVNAANIAIGEVWLGNLKRVLAPNIEWGEVQSDERKIVENRTNFGVSTIYDLGTTQRRLKASLTTTDAGRDELRSWWRDARGRFFPFLVIPDDTLNDAYLVRWANTSLDRTLQFLDVDTLALEFEEVGRGLVL